MSEQQSRMKAAPYASFLKFLEMLNGFHAGGIPERVTHSNIGDFSREVKSHLLQALKFLSLIDESGVPTDSFQGLFAGEPRARTELFQRIILDSYKCPLEGVDLATVQRSELLESFNVCYSTAKDTTRKCVRFFAYAAIAGGLKLSSDLLQLADGNRDNGETCLTQKLFGQELPDDPVHSGKMSATADANQPEGENRVRTSRGSAGGTDTRGTNADRTVDRKSQRYDALIDLFDPELMTEQELRAGVVMLKFARRCAEASVSV